MTQDIPKQGDILLGVVVRIEAYGAFCRLRGPRGPQGLIHISQLSSDRRVENVEDVVSVNDEVWVKVLEVEMDPSTQRWKIRLSRKDVSQDGLATDLALERETKDTIRDQLELNLNSMIGMGVARDPMADRLMMKNDGIRRGTTFRGGYLLVGDDEGEAPALAQDEPSKTTIPPMGRGRGTTLPAWMTEAKEGPIGESLDEDRCRTPDKTKKKEERKESKRKRSSRKSKRSHRTYDDADSRSENEEDERASRVRHRRKSRDNTDDGVQDERSCPEFKGRRERSNRQKEYRTRDRSASSCDSRDERIRHKHRRKRS